MKYFLQYFLGAPGRWFIQSTHTFFATLQFTFCVLQRGLHYQHKHPKHKVIKQVTTAQIIFSGIDALFPTLFILSLLISFSVTAQLILFLQNIATEKEVISLLTQFIALQLSPTITAIVLIARSGSAITVDLGNMSINHEIKGLRLLGVDPLIYLAYPRLIGLAISQMTLAVYFSVLTMLLGVLFAGLLGSPSNFKYFFILIDAISITELWLFLIKNAICGIAIAAYACYFGLQVKNSVTEVPQATQQAIVKSLMAIFFINAIFALF